MQPFLAWLATHESTNNAIWYKSILLVTCECDMTCKCDIQLFVRSLAWQQVSNYCWPLCLIAILKRKSFDEGDSGDVRIGRLLVAAVLESSRGMFVAGFNVERLHITIPVSVFHAFGPQSVLNLSNGFHFVFNLLCEENEQGIFDAILRGRIGSLACHQLVPMLWSRKCYDLTLKNGFQQLKYSVS
ncbi:hypothetical protein VNO80_23883 [Phaseolus coccineus]|uniref:Uncharacterized protein n=1 Tax=Phaseolus coccineus TaxID=3886 RepID=A0AAN9MCY1_PHACN